MHIGTTVPNKVVSNIKLTDCMVAELLRIMNNVVSTKSRTQHQAERKGEADTWYKIDL